MSKDIAISVKNVSKSFKLPIENTSGIKQAILNVFRKNRKKGYINQHVLKGVSFDIEKGDFFGIVGRNGSGKSTLLKIISGIYTPEKGAVKINGSLTPFIELGVGFNPELTGRENVFLNGALLGFSRKEMEAMYDEIVEFAELEKFMDQKLKNYSSGMQVRLAFSIAIRADTDILVLDEVLAVGDEAFQRKCNNYFQEIKKNKNKTIILVTHSMESVRQYCNKAVLINDGELKTAGNPDKIASMYSKMFVDEYIEEQNEKSENKFKSTKLSDMDLLGIDIVQNEVETSTVSFGEDFVIKLKIKSDQDRDNLNMGVHIFDQSGKDMIVASTKVLNSFGLKNGINYIYIKIQNILSDNRYYINMAIEDKGSKKLLLQVHDSCQFSVVGVNLSNKSKHALTHPNMEFEVGISR